MNLCTKCAFHCGNITSASVCDQYQNYNPFGPTSNITYKIYFKTLEDCKEHNKLIRQNVTTC